MTNNTKYLTKRELKLTTNRELLTEYTNMVIESTKQENFRLHGTTKRLTEYLTRLENELDKRLNIKNEKYYL